MLGWRILNKGQYRLTLPRLSEDEERVVLALEEEFKERTRSEAVESRIRAEELVQQLLHGYAQRHRMYIDEKQLAYLARIAALHIYGYAFLDELLANDSIEEISVIGIGKPAYVYVRSQGWQSVNAAFTNEKALMEIVNKMAHEIGRRITLQSPRLDAMLPDGSRLHASLPPLSQGEITIRKFRLRPYSPIELWKGKTMDRRALAILSLILQSDQSLVIAGNTASGKTTLLNALFSFVPADERVLITEETPEINIPHPHRLRLVANREMGITLKDLIYDSLRMRPDRTIVGEVRNREEVEALFDVLHGGQARGTYATLHAQSAAEATKRLKAFGIEEYQSVDWFVVQKRMLRFTKTGRQEIRRLVELASPVHGPWIAYRPREDDWKEEKNARMLETLGQSLGLTARETSQEIARREQRLMRMPTEFFECFTAIQKGYGLDADRSAD